MKKFYAFVQKEFYHIFRDTRTMMILFALPIALVVIFGYALNNDFKNIPIGILNQSKDQTSVKLIHRIIGSGYFVVEQTLEKTQDIPKAFKSGKVKLVVFFPMSFQQDLYHAKKRKYNSLQMRAILIPQSIPPVIYRESLANLITKMGAKTAWVFS